MTRVINFNPGPAALPLPALERAREELLDFQNSGMSIMEHSHRGREYESVHNEAIALVRELLGVPDSHEVLFMQGGGHQQFALVPMNLLHPGKSADYVLTGGWSERAYEEAQNVGTVRIAASTEQNKRYTRIPSQSEIALDPSAAYVHITSNNTLFGTQWHYVPDVGDVPLVADMSSDFLWKKFDVTKYSLIYACAQKNLGPSGVTVVVLKKSLLTACRENIPVIFRYKTHAENNSLYNTPATFAVYMVRNVFSWQKQVGGLDQIERWNREKADVLYRTIDSTPEFYRAPAAKDSRSMMNVVFRLPTEQLEEQFIAAAKKEGMVGLKGHRSTGGIRVSIYNAVSPESVRALADFMNRFAKANGG